MMLYYCYLSYIGVTEKSNLKQTVRNSSKKLANAMVAVGVAVEPAVDAEGLYTRKMRAYLS